MSKLMVQTFFPKLFQWVMMSTSDHQGTAAAVDGGVDSRILWNNIGRYILNDVVFPDDVASKCPEVVVTFDSMMTNFGVLRIRQPFLAICAAWGVWISSRAVIDLSSSLPSSPRRYNDPDIQKQQRQQELNNHSQRQYVLWIVAFGAFGMMNLSALPLHCFFDGPTMSSTYPDISPILWMIDTYMTGLSSICLYLASLDRTVTTSPPPPPSVSSQPPSPTSSASRNSTTVGSLQESIHEIIRSHFEVLWMFGWFLHGVGLSCMICFNLSKMYAETATTKSSSIMSNFSSFGLELWYLLTPPIAGIPIMYMVLLDPARRHRGCESDDSNPSTLSTTILDGRLVFHSGASIVLIGVLIDRFVCQAIGTSFFDMFSATTAVFFGCDCCFLGIHMILVNGKNYGMRSRDRKNKLKNN